MIKRNSVMAASGLICAAVVAGTALANFDRYFISDTVWGVRVYRLPDLDQRRDNLPNNGSMYCVPTAAVNAYAYTARHGYPNVTMPDHHYVWWARDENYDEVTGHLALTGFLMGTDPSNGTNGAGGLSGFGQMQGGAADDLMVLRFQADKDYYAFAFDDLAGWAMAGAIVVPIIGWYPDQQVTYRDGGHAVTLVGAWREGSGRVIAFRDPAIDEPGADIDLDAQSTYRTSVYNVVQRPVDIITGYGPVTRIMDEVVGISSGDTLGLLDGFYVIYPYEGYTTTTDNYGLVRIRPGSWSFDIHDVIENLDTAVRPIRDLLIDPATARPLFLTEADSDFPTIIYRYDPVSDTSNPIIARAGIAEMEISRKRRLYVRTGTNVYCYSIDGTGAATETTSAALPDVMSSMCYDDVNDRLCFLSSSNQWIYPFDPDLTPLPAVPVPGGSGLLGPTSMTASPVDGSLWLASTFGSTLAQLVLSNPVDMTVYDLPAGIFFPANLSVTDSGRIHLTSGGVIKVLETSAPGTLVEVPDAQFAGLPVGGSLHLPHSRTNHDPAVMESPEYFHVLPTVYDEGVADCLADLDGPFDLPDGVVDVTDLLTLLAAWGACPVGADCTGDITGSGGAPDGQVDVQDLLELLARWGSCGALPLVP